MENIEWLGLSYLAVAYTYESLNHKKVGTAAHVRLNPQIPSKVKNKVHWEKNQVDVGHECNYELNGPNAVAGWKLGSSLFRNIKIGHTIAAKTYNTTEITRNINTNLSKLKGKQVFSFF